MQYPSDKAPANNVVIAVICNTDYVYKGDDTRKAHYDYWLKQYGGNRLCGYIRKWYDGLAVKNDEQTVVTKEKTPELKLSFRTIRIWS